MTQLGASFDYDEIVRMVQQRPPPTAVICRSVEEAEALVAWIDEFEEREREALSQS